MRRDPTRRRTVRYARPAQHAAEARRVTASHGSLDTQVQIQRQRQRAQPLVTHDALGFARAQQVAEARVTACEITMP